MPKIIIKPVKDDTAIESGYPDAIRTGDDTMWVGRYSRNSIYRDLMKFDLSDMNDCVDITSAILKLYVCDVTDPAVCAYVTPYLVTQKWQGNAVNWESAPGYDELSHGLTVPVKNAGFYQWDITEFMSHWFKHTKTNFGVLLKSTEAADGETKRFATSENLNAELRPGLKITYSHKEKPVQPENPSEGEADPEFHEDNPE